MEFFSAGCRFVFDVILLTSYTNILIGFSNGPVVFNCFHIIVLQYFPERLNFTQLMPNYCHKSFILYKNHFKFNIQVVLFMMIFLKRPQSGCKTMKDKRIGQLDKTSLFNKIH